MKYFFTLLATVALAGALCAQYTGDSLYYLYPTDTMLLKVDGASANLVFEHHLAPKQTVYGASKFYGRNVEDFYALSPELRRGYDVGDVIKVAIAKELIRYEIPGDSLAWFVPVRYQLAKGETLYGLAVRRLGWLNPDPITRLNPEVDPSQLKTGATLVIGYLPISGLPFTGRVYADAYQAQNAPLRALWESRTAGKEMPSENGKAAWTKKGDRTKFMVLHRTAPINSVIEIEDPRSRRTLYARVMGRIPEQIYKPEVMLVVSPLLVKAFGVRDKLFYVKTRHF
ncbi:LysM domain-containing protein [Lewinella sp. 4G2]|uniref:LysM domain-containing protein n=1 Tax=Lewinella sp. 4G2 TaxID=1803372 RepID=UPI0007B4AC2D|nr:LysM domain-containing protein [Lewinella sp. 4G2]OAV45713.1 hypothetical protein A3850_014970 [Lewinella sp. 4G2]